MAARRRRRSKSKKCSEKRRQRLVMILGPRCKIEKTTDPGPPAIELTSDMVRDRVRSRRRKGAIELQPTTTTEQGPTAQVCAKAPGVPGELVGVPSTSAAETIPSADASESVGKSQQKDLTVLPSASSDDAVIVAIKKAPTPIKQCATSKSAVALPGLRTERGELDLGVSFCEWKLRRIYLPRIARRVPNKAAPGPGVDPRGSPKPRQYRTAEPAVTYIPTPKAELARRRKEAAAQARALLRPVEEPEDIFAEGGPISDADYEAWKARPYSGSLLRRVLM
ncbi:hypothetical protein TKK_0009426 [Trichogramma kaykai]